MPYSRHALRWNGWGRVDATFDLRGRDDKVWELVGQIVGRTALPNTPAKPLDEIALSPAMLDAAQVRALQQTGAEIYQDDYERAFHALGKSYFDLIRLRRGDLTMAPDAVAYPASHDETLAVLRCCHELGIEAVPFGGGSSVVGGVDGKRNTATPSLTVDTTRMRRMLELDEVSHTALFETGVYGPDLEANLQAAGFTLGHYPQSFEYSTLGGWIAARGAGQQSNRYGTANKWLVAARLATPVGSWETQPFPQSAAGPDLNEMIAGSEGVLGIITQARIRVHELPATKDYRAFVFRDFHDGVRAIRSILHAEVPVAMVRLSDAAETGFLGSFQRALKPESRRQALTDRAMAATGFSRPCILLVGAEGHRPVVAASQARVTLLCAQQRGVPLGKKPGKSWYKKRFALPFLRDPLMDRGVGVDTLETSTTWSNIEHLHQAVSQAMAEELGGRGKVMGHISHVYKDGASLYFTAIFERDLSDEIGQWRRLKIAASDAIANNGGTISHHHGVGQDHRNWLAAEKSELGLEMLRSAKRKVDPNGILNPGKLL